MSKDINDLGAGPDGMSIADQIAAAKARPTTPLRDLAARAAAAAEGIAILQAAIDAMATAQDRPIRHLIDLMRRETIALLALAYQVDQVTVTRLLREARSHRGCASQADEVLGMVREAAEPPRDATGEGPDKRPPDPHGYRGLTIPTGYAVSDAGVFAETEKGSVQVCRAPIVITGRTADIDTGDRHLTLGWLDEDGWTERTVERDEAMDARRLVRLARKGAPVSSGSSALVVRYLDALEADNRDRLPYQASCAHLGWAGDRFILPARSYPPGASLRATEGTDQLARAVRTEGTWDGWCAAIRTHAASRPLLMLGLYASVCTVLLRVLDAPGFVVDWSGETSGGKTTVLRVAASVYGVPSDEQGLIGRWLSSSDVGPTTSAWFLQSLPLILDDTKQGRPEVIGALLYTIPGGNGRSKGTVDGGLQRTPTWRTCLLSTGEAPITSFLPHGGAVARTLCLTGPPMGESSPENERAARDLEGALLAHHGHLGPRLAEYLTGDPAVAARLRKRHRAVLTALVEHAGSAVAARMARYVATLVVAREVCTELGVPGHVGEDPIDVALAATRVGSEESDRPREAMAALVRWAVSNQAKFWGRHSVTRDGEPIEPTGGYVGRWDTGGARENWVCIRPEVLRDLLDGWGFDVAGVLASWDKREWTVATPAGNGSAPRRRQVSVKIGGVKVRLVAIPPKVFADLGA